VTEKLLGEGREMERDPLDWGYSPQNKRKKRRRRRRGLQKGEMGGNLDARPRAKSCKNKGKTVNKWPPARKSVKKMGQGTEVHS